VVSPLVGRASNGERDVTWRSAGALFSSRCGERGQPASVIGCAGPVARARAVAVRVRLREWLRRSGGAGGRCAQCACPVGGALGGERRGGLCPGRPLCGPDTARPAAQLSVM
jgi:hypothetical protein